MIPGQQVLNPSNILQTSAFKMTSPGQIFPRLKMLHAPGSPRLHRPLPPGFTLRGMVGEEDIAAWVSIWREAHPGLAVDAARFHRAFGNDPALIAERCLLLSDPSGFPIGVGAAWYDDDFCGAPAGRVHWLALRPTHQGLGLGSALLCSVLDLLTRLHSRNYLVTQGDRLDAIRLYMRHGFLPHTPNVEDQQNWNDVLERIDHGARSL